ncbi:recombinase family protein [[Clostridium] innocuum]|uniref:recombinase family protein n=1 Tax=Clostridium innocuum TaxID=1522 RepID=UPI003A4E4FFF
MKVEDLTNILQKANDAYTYLSAQGIDEEILTSFHLLIESSEALIQKEISRKEKQMIGIRKAQQKGIHLGRPNIIPCNQEFLKMVYLHNKKIVTAAEAAEKLHISKTTFYTMKRKYHKEIVEWKT